MQVSWQIGSSDFSYVFPSRQLSFKPLDREGGRRKEDKKSDLKVDSVFKIVFIMKPHKKIK